MVVEEIVPETTHVENPQWVFVPKHEDRTEGTGGTSLFPYQKPTHTDDRLPSYNVVGRLFPAQSPELHVEIKLEDAAEARFNRLAAQWRAETSFCSSVIEMATRPAYQQIIGMGRIAVPYILRDLAKGPQHWFWALIAITGENPVDEDDKGNLPRMTQAWLEWGTKNGYEC